MPSPLGDKKPAPPKARGPEWEKTATPGIWRNRDTGHIETWFDMQGKPARGEPPSKRPAEEDG